MRARLTVVEVRCGARSVDPLVAHAEAGLVEEHGVEPDVLAEAQQLVLALGCSPGGRARRASAGWRARCSSSTTIARPK